MSGFPSTAAVASAVRSPGRRPDELATVTVAWPGAAGRRASRSRPTRLLTTWSAVRVEIRANPPIEKFRAVGKVNSRANVSSGSVLGGVEGFAR